MNKNAYLSPSVGRLDVIVIRDANPSIHMNLDLGIPNFTVFSLKFPLAEGEPKKMSVNVREGLHALLGEVSSFMMSLEFPKETITQIYAAVLECFDTMTGDSESAKNMPEYTNDPIVKDYIGTFQLPQDFVNDTQKFVVTGAKVVKHSPPAVRKIILDRTPPTPSKPKANDVERVIRMYKNRSLVNQPRPMYVVVYDQTGRPQGVMQFQKPWKSPLLKSVVGKEEHGKLMMNLQGQDGDMYFKGHPVKIKTLGNGTAEIHDANTGKLLLKPDVKELGRVAHAV